MKLAHLHKDDAYPLQGSLNSLRVAIGAVSALHVEPWLRRVLNHVSQPSCHHSQEQTRKMVIP
eukprot:4781182-Amphidinium_carterae.1